MKFTAVFAGTVAALAGFASAQNSTVPSIGDALAAANLTRLAQALALASPDALEKISALTNITVFAPTNAAFDAAIAEYVGLYNSTPDSMITQAVIAQHILYNIVAEASDISNGLVLTNAAGSPISFGVMGGNVTATVEDYTGIYTANVVTPNVMVMQGVVHVIDMVLASIDTIFTPMMMVNSTGNMTMV